MSRTVLVVGAGIAGLATARALGVLGLDYRVVERRPHGSSMELALNLPGNAVAALHRLGAADHVLTAGVPIARREYRTAGDRVLFAVDEAGFWSGGFGSVCARHQVVLDALAAGVSVDRAVAVAALEQRADGSVDIRFADEHEDLVDFVVAADGVHSTVRTALAPAAPRPSLMTSASWRFITADPGVDCWTAWTGHGRTFLLIPAAPREVTPTPPAAKVAPPGPTRPGSPTPTLTSPSRSPERSTRPSRHRFRRTTHRSRKSGSPPGTTAT